MTNASSRHTIGALSELRLTPSLAETRLALLPFVSAEEINAMKECKATRRTLAKGADLIRESEACHSLYFVEEGRACQHTTTRDGRRQISALLLPGDLCNSASLLMPRLHCGVRFLTAGSVMAVPRANVAALAATHPGISQGFFWLGLVENAILSRRTLCLGRLSALERVAYLFCELAVRLGFPSGEGEISFGNRVTQEQVGDILGLTPVHVNRTMQQLRKDGLLLQRKRTIEIPDIGALRLLGKFEPSYLE